MLLDKHKNNYVRSPKVGVALSGGGLRGFTHIGVLAALVENGIPIDMIAGTSAGAIVAAFYATGYMPQDMRKILDSISLRNFVDLKVTVKDLFTHGLGWLVARRFKFWSVLPAGLLKGDKIEGFLQRHWHDKSLRDVEIPLAVTAVDINSGDTIYFTTPYMQDTEIPNARYFHNTTLCDAVRASISIPGIFFPKKYRSMTLVDGAVTNNLPTDILKNMGADIVIGVDLGYAGDPNYNITSVGEIIIQSLDIMGREVTLLKGEQYADIVIRPLTAMIRFNQPERAQFVNYIERGRIAALQHIGQIKQLIADQPPARLLQE